ncbi:hypothetical protein SAMN04487846_1723 [Microbacterium sp. cf046]|uniref:hypothetical protein n=1 Tax=Microbacterium sp. cf046 TaxID=1761803 RepID=UPI0008E69B83|nr:hypothetical protein [Microbacterium sp. cf046]SFS03915.1 hypothetical protein SAMN04487846_1723 [Microbacterium sp. cf046]
MSNTPVAAPRPRGRTMGRRLVLLGQRILRSDTILITVIAVSMSLSAVAVYQATRAADEASDLLDQSRIVSTEASRQVGYLQTLVDHDLDVLRTYCTAEVQRDVARVTYLSYEPDLPALVTANLELDGLRPLLLGDRDAQCGSDLETGYVMQRAAERLQSWQADFGSDTSDGAELEAQAAVFHRDEAFLMTAGFLFAFVVAAIIAIDQLGSRRARPGRLRTRAAHRWQYAMLVLGAVALALGLVLLVVFAVDPLLTVAVLAALAIVLVVEWALLRRKRAADAETRAASDVPASAPPLRRGARPQWWAEMIGAVALIAFTASAVGLSLVSIQERDSNARANRESSVALDLQRVGQQQALRALASLSFIAQMDAEEVTARQLAASETSIDLAPSDADPDAVSALRAVVDERLRAADQDLREQAASTLAGDPDPDCKAEAASEAPLPSELLEELGSNPDSVLWYVLDQQLPSRACDVMSSLSRQDARIWSSHGSTFTVALVVLGLAGFLLALASSTERTTRSSRTLLIIGAVGTGVGIVLALLPLPTLVMGTNVPRGAAAQEFGDRLAAAESDSCTAGEGMDEALAAYSGYGPAFSSRAFARDCAAAVHQWPALSSQLQTDAVPAIIDDLERALAVGPVTPTLQGSLGWYYILDGIQTGDEGAVRQGLRHTDDAIEALRVDSASTGNGIHTWRFNRALALAALGQHDEALREYQDTEHCLDPAADCAGGGLSEDEVNDGTRLGALADLELLPEAAGLDDFRAAILGLRASRGPGTGLDEARFDVYPQELQVALIEGFGPDDAEIVWYYRPDDSLTWGLLGEPTRASIDGTGPLGRPIPAGSLLATGEYRADVYVSGHRVVFYDTYESDDSLARYESQRLGVSVVVPDTWYEWRDDGVEWHLGPDEATGLTVRRVEGMVPYVDVGGYLDEKLSSTWGDPDLVPVPDPWLFALFDIVVKEGQDVDADGEADVYEGAALAPYASDWGCGGTLFMVRATSTEDSPSAWRLYNSLVLERPLDGLPPRGEVLEADGVSLEVPSWWDAAIRPEGSTGNLFSAKDCVGGATLVLSTQEYDGDLGGYIDASIRTYSTLPEGLPGFTLESRTPLEVAGADAAELLVYTWLPDGYTEPLRDWEMYAMRGTTVAYADITADAADLEFYQQDLDVILPSMSMTDP